MTSSADKPAEHPPSGPVHIREILPPVVDDILLRYSALRTKQSLEETDSSVFSAVTIEPTSIN